jgi:hypothetical protein
MLSYLLLVIIWLIVLYNLHVVATYARDYIYQFKRGIIRSLALQILIALVVMGKLADAVNKGTLLDQLAVLGLLVVAVYSCIISASHGEGISEKGLFAFLSFTPWEDVESYEWRPHFMDNNSYLVLRLKPKNHNHQERYTVIRNENKALIDEYLKKYIHASE